VAQSTAENTGESTAESTAGSTAENGSDRPRRSGALLHRALTRVGNFLAGLPRGVGVVLVLAWMGLIWALSEREGSRDLPATDVFAWIGNLAHAPLFGLLGLLALGAVARPRRDGWERPRGRALAALFAFVVAYGLVDEWHQASTPGRTSSLSDVLTDAVGAASVLLVADFLARSRAGERGLFARLALGACACGLAAAWATWG